MSGLANASHDAYRRENEGEFAGWVDSPLTLILSLTYATILSNGLQARAAAPVIPHRRGLDLTAVSLG